MSPSWPYFIAANQFVLNLNLNLILIAEMIEPILDGFILLSAVKLPWNLYHAGSNHLSFRGRKTVLRPKLVPRLFFFAPSCRGELWSEKADGLGLRQRIVKIQSQNRPKRNAILDLRLQLMVRPVVAGIQNYDLEPESNTKRLSACVGLWLLVSNTVARVWPNSCQLALPSASQSCWPQELSVDDERNHPIFNDQWANSSNKWAENDSNIL